MTWLAVANKRLALGSGILHIRQGGVELFYRLLRIRYRSHP